MSGQRTATSPEDFVDFYDVLRVSPRATALEIVQGVNRRLAELANPDLDPSLSARAEIFDRATAAVKVLTDLRSRFMYDIVRMMNLGELTLSPPRGDLPSREVAHLRFKLVLVVLKKTLNALVEAYNVVDDELTLENSSETNIEVGEQLKEALDQMWIFCAHITLQINSCVGALDAIKGMSNDAWAYGIRDPGVDADTEQVSMAKTLLRKLQTTERHIHQQFWQQIAQALRMSNDEDLFAYPKRLLRILDHLRF